MRLQRLVDRLLSLAGVEKRQALEQTEIIDLAEIAAIELEAKRPLAERKNLTLLQLDTGSDCTLEGDRFLLEQAISNLLDNAIEFSLPGGTIAVQIGASDTALSLRVRNDGPAVPTMHWVGYSSVSILCRDRTASARAPVSG
ncbi:ATP-binding protein [Halopseudomonas pachastrellae]|nr:ATP-binding protein [Halopseudomonas pachastrellae]